SDLRAATAGDRADVEVQQAVGVAVDDLLVGDLRPPVDDQADVEGSTAHVGGDDVLVAVHRGQGRGAGQPAGGAGVDGAQRGRGGLVGGQDSAVGLHHRHRAGQSGPA